jgi:hypothetical protein
MKGMPSARSSTATRSSRSPKGHHVPPVRSDPALHLPHVFVRPERRPGSVPTGIAVQTGGNDVRLPVVAPITLRRQMFGSGLKSTRQRWRQGMRLRESGWICSPHRLPAIIAASILIAKGRIADLLYIGHCSPALGPMRCAAACAYREELLLAPKATSSLPPSSGPELSLPTFRRNTRSGSRDARWRASDSGTYETDNVTARRLTARGG